MRIETLHSPHGRELRDGEPCSHPGCLRHISHPCEGCGRVGGRTEYTGHCKNCGAEQDDHYDGAQCPLGNGLYSSTKNFTWSGKGK